MALFPPRLWCRILYRFVIFILSVYLFHDITVQSIPESEIGYQAKNFPTEAIRAISRTKTKSCSLELAQFVDEQVKQSIHAINFQGTCPSIDQHIPRLLGCSYTLNDTLYEVADFGHPSDNTSDREICLKFCFSRGHSFAAHRISDMTCRCTNQFEKNELPTKVDPLACELSRGTEIYKVSPTRSHAIEPGKLENLDEVGSIKIAFLLTLNGRSILQIRRLLKMIYFQQHLYYIHVDVRRRYLFEKLLPLESLRPNVILAKKRLDTIWGGSTLLRMMLNSISNLLDYQWDYVINLSETDLPLKSITELEYYLASHSRSTIYLKAHNMTGDRFIKKQGLDQWFYQCENRMWRLGKRQLPMNILYSGGSDWFALPRDFCEAILREADNPEGLVQPLLQLFNYTLLPAESFFHTIALNTEFCNRSVDNNLRMTNWQRDRDCGCQHKQVVDWCGCSPRIYRWADLKRLQKTKLSQSIFFSRKFDPTISSSIIGFVEQYLLNNEDFNTLRVDTRYWLNVWETGDDQLELRKLNSYYQFGLFALNQIIDDQNRIRSLLLESIDLFFNEDRFVGVILKYCEATSQCGEILVVRNTSAHLNRYNTDCFIDKIQFQLRVIEVNDDFDTSERVFRNYMPLITSSALVVYHEWLTNVKPNQNASHKRKVRFKWINPKNESKLDQDVKLTAKIEQPHLFLAHKMSVAGPLDSGLWHLRVYDKLTECLDYQFLIFDEASYDLKDIEQDQFNQFYQVAEACSFSDSAGFQPCNATDWSSEARDAKLATYDLI